MRPHDTPLDDDVGGVALGGTTCLTLLVYYRLLDHVQPQARMNNCK